MYGGHIVNDFDRLLARTYLDFISAMNCLKKWNYFRSVNMKKMLFQDTAGPSL